MQEEARAVTPRPRSATHLPTSQRSEKEPKQPHRPGRDDYHTGKEENDSPTFTRFHTPCEVQKSICLHLDDPLAVLDYLILSSTEHTCCSLHAYVSSPHCFHRLGVGYVLYTAEGWLRAICSHAPGFWLVNRFVGSGVCAEIQVEQRPLVDSTLGPDPLGTGSYDFIFDRRSDLSANPRVLGAMKVPSATLSGLANSGVELAFIDHVQFAGRVEELVERAIEDSMSYDAKLEGEVSYMSYSMHMIGRNMSHLLDSHDSRWHTTEIFLEVLTSLTFLQAYSPSTVITNSLLTELKVIDKNINLIVQDSFDLLNLLNRIAAGLREVEKLVARDKVVADSICNNIKVRYSLSQELPEGRSRTWAEYIKNIDAMNR